MESEKVKARNKRRDRQTKTEKKNILKNTTQKKRKRKKGD